MTLEQILQIETTTGYKSEDHMQSMYYQYARNKYHLHGLLFSVPNGGSRNKAEALKMVATGLTAGIPDLLLIMPTAPHLIGIELKLPKGKLSDTQVTIHKRWAEAGIQVEVVRDILHFDKVIKLSQ